MADNGGFIPAKPFRTSFKFKEGVHQLGTSRFEAGARVAMNWNQAMLAQAQGWGEVEIGRRPHHNRPHLLAGGKAPEHELQPSDGLSAQERAQLRVAGLTAGNAAGGSSSSKAAAASQGLEPALQLRSHLQDAPLQLAAPTAKPSSAGGRGKLPKSAAEALSALLTAWTSLHEDLRGVWIKSPRALKIGNGVFFFGETGRWGRSEGRPDGLGALVLTDGTQHLGSFREGRADGEGLYLGQKGTVLFGRWRQNLRVGDFVAVDAQGKVWLEEYDSSGKRCSREAATCSSPSSSADGATALGPAVACETCKLLYHLEFDHQHACRSTQQEPERDAGCSFHSHRQEP